MKNIPIQWNDAVKIIEGNLNENAEWKNDLHPGTASWLRGKDEKASVIIFTCPCGCKDVISIPVREGFGNTFWNWDGNEKFPTLSPSIFRSSGCKWHGHLINGEFVSC